MSPIPEASSARSIWSAVLLTLVLITSFGLKLYHLGHTDLTHWDEAYHAVVARNVMKHPWQPTLVDAPYLPFDSAKWTENHVWLHKPILPFWIIAVSFALFGVNTFALRLPAAVFSTLAAGLTYLIGCRLLDRRSALLAAALQSFNPFLMSLIHGYMFADNIDILLLFWVELGIYFVVRAGQTGRTENAVFAGVAQGLAYLSKSYLAAIVLGVALTAWILPRVRLISRDSLGLTWRGLALLTVSSLATVAPWSLYCVTTYPDEYWHEHTMVLRHLYSNVESWAAPWDRLVFDYLIAIYGIFYTPIIVATVVLTGKAFLRRHAGLWLLLAWGIGVILPHLFAVTKTPSGTVIALPAFSLLLGHLLSEASRNEIVALTAASAVALMSVVFPAVVREPGFGYPATYYFGAIMSRSMWVVYHLIGALAVSLTLWLNWVMIRYAASRLSRRPSPDETSEKKLPWILAHVVQPLLLAFCAISFAWLTFRMVESTWSVINKKVDDAPSVVLGQFARQLEENAVLLCEKRHDHEHLNLMFYSDRTVYLVTPDNRDTIARQVLASHGIPYLVSRRSYPFPILFQSGGRGSTVYAWRPTQP